MICVIDFDETFFKNDFFKESFYKKLIENPFYFIRHFLINRGNLLDLKKDLLSNTQIEYPIEFLINTEILRWIQLNKENYEKIVLVSASPDFFIKKVVGHLSYFDELHGSNTTNLKGANKLEYILNKWGENFDYIGDSKADTPIFNRSKNAFKITAKGLINVKK